MNHRWLLLRLVNLTGEFERIFSAPHCYLVAVTKALEHRVQVGTMFESIAHLLPDFNCRHARRVSMEQVTNYVSLVACVGIVLGNLRRDNLHRFSFTSRQMQLLFSSSSLAELF